VSLAAWEWRRRSRPNCAFAAWLLAASLLALPASAQEGSPPAAQAPASKSRGGDSIAERLGRLEEKVQSLQVTIGTIESFTRTKPNASLGIETNTLAAQTEPGAQSDLGPRIDALETQISALTSHIEQIGRQMSALEAKLSALPGSPAPALPQPSPAPQSEPPPLRDGEAPAPPDDTATASVGTPSGTAENSDPSKPRWYGPKPGSDQLAALLEREAASGAPPQGAPDNAPQNLTAALTGSNAQTLYQQGYGALLQKDYAGAEATFRELVENYPDDPLASDAQYWIGETYFVRGQYKKAADAFLSGYKKFKSGQKAPDILLKLGMSLVELGQKGAACSTFDELKTKYPEAPPHIGGEARTWQKKAGC
jgi:tol-pal system protein YbgF